MVAPSVVLFGQDSASMGATVARSFMASARCRSRVISASAWSWVRAAYSASKVSGQPSRAAAFQATSWRTRSPEQPDPQPAHVARAAARHPSWSSRRGVLPGREATAPGSAAASGPGSDGRRGSRPGRGPGGRRRPGRSRTWSWQISFPPFAVARSACPGVGGCRAAYRHHAGASMQGSYIGLMAVCGAHRSAAALADAAG